MCLWHPFIAHEVATELAGTETKGQLVHSSVAYSSESPRTEHGWPRSLPPCWRGISLSSHEMIYGPWVTRITCRIASVFLKCYLEHLLKETRFRRKTGPSSHVWAEKFLVFWVSLRDAEVNNSFLIAFPHL